MTEMPDPAVLPTERLEHEITTLAAQLAAATCRWLLLVAELDRREGWLTWGARSCAHWLSFRCGIALSTAREQVRVAHALRSLPETRTAFCRGTVELLAGPGDHERWSWRLSRLWMSRPRTRP